MSNVGTMDRLVRLILGSAMISLVFFEPQTAWGWIGLIPLSTALIAWCPIYTAAGISTQNKTAEQTID